MLAILPVLFFALVFDILWRRSDYPDPRTSFLSAAVTWGLVVILLTEVLSLFNAISAVALAVGWGAATIVAVLVSFRERSPTRPLPRISLRSISLLDVLFGAPIVAIVLGTGFIAFVGWPNNWDGLNYHLPRAAHWAQNGSVAHYPTHITQQLFFPPWASYATLHLTLLGSDERFANLVQWFSMLGSVLGVALIARRLGATPRGQLFSALFAATIPMGIVQASSVQNDYVTTFWLVCMVNAVLAWRAQPRFSSAIAVGASLGLALLTKLSAYIFVLPGVLVFLFAARPYRWPGFPKQAALIGLAAVALNAPHYTRNVELFGSPFGTNHLGAGAEGNRRLNKVHDELTVGVFASNLVRNLAYHLGSPSPILNTALEETIRGAFAHFGYELDDPRGTFLNKTFIIIRGGPNDNATRNFVHAILIGLSAVAIVSFRVWRSAGHVWSYALVLVLGMVTLSALIKWEPQHSRLTLPLFVLASALVGLVLQRHRLVMAAAALSMAVWAWPFVMDNPVHPLLGEANVLRFDRRTQYFLQSPDRLVGYVSAMGFLDSHGCNQVGLILNWFEVEYQLWALLPDVRTGHGRMEHVGVQNVSARLANRRPPFSPCAVVEVRGPAAQALQIENAAYSRVWLGNRVAVYVPDVFAEEQAGS